MVFDRVVGRSPVGIAIGEIDLVGRKGDFAAQAVEIRDLQTWTIPDNDRALPRMAVPQKAQHHPVGAVLIRLHPGRIQQVIMGKLGFKPVNLLCQFVSLGTQPVLSLEMQRRGLVLLTKGILSPARPEP